MLGYMEYLAIPAKIVAVLAARMQARRCVNAKRGF